MLSEAALLNPDHFSGVRNRKFLQWAFSKNAQELAHATLSGEGGRVEVANHTLRSPTKLLPDPGRRQLPLRVFEAGLIPPA